MVEKQARNIHQTLIELTGELLRTVNKYYGAVKEAQAEYARNISAAVTAKTKEMARAIDTDDSDDGKRMKDILLSLREGGCMPTESPFLVRGLSELESIKLVKPDVNPASLYADIDTYETDPTVYVLTDIGRIVANRIASGDYNEEAVATDKRVKGSAIGRRDG